MKARTAKARAALKKHPKQDAFDDLAARLHDMVEVIGKVGRRKAKA